MPCISFTLAGWSETKKEKNNGRSNFPPRTVNRYEINLSIVVLNLVSSQLSAIHTYMSFMFHWVPIAAIKGLRGNIPHAL